MEIFNLLFMAVDCVNWLLWLHYHQWHPSWMCLDCSIHRLRVISLPRCLSRCDYNYSSCGYLIHDSELPSILAVVIFLITLDLILNTYMRLPFGSFMSFRCSIHCFLHSLDETDALLHSCQKGSLMSIQNSVLPHIGDISNCSGLTYWGKCWGVYQTPLVCCGQSFPSGVTFL